MNEYLKVLRLDHWIKNVFTLLGCWASLIYFSIPISVAVLSKIAIGVLLSCIMSSVNYVINEILDAPLDALHPTKKNRPIPSGRVKIINLYGIIIILFVLTGSCAYFFFNASFTISLFLLFMAGLIYNVRPIRAKDIPYIDVISESINNPIRLCIGWYCLANVHQFPPWTILWIFWFFGAFLMTGKRLAEIRHLRSRAAPYRPTFKSYTQKSLMRVMQIYGVVSFIFFILLAIEYQKRLLWVSPLFFIFLYWYVRLSLEKDSIVMGPEHLYRKPLFFLYALFFCVMTLLVSIL